MSLKKNNISIISAGTKKGLLLCASVLAAALISCETGGTGPSEKDMTGFVVQGYLYRGQPVHDVQVLSLIPFGSEDTVIQSVELDEETGDTLEIFYDTVKIVDPINDADVKIIVDGKTHSLAATGDSGWYADEDEGLIIQENKNYRIEVSLNGHTAFAEASVPPPPEELSISSDTLFRAPRVRRQPGDTAPPQQPQLSENQPTNLLVKWKNEDGAPYYIVSETVQMDTTGLPPGFANFINRGGWGRPRGSFTNADTILVTTSRQRGQRRGRVGQIQAGRAGKYMIKVYRITEEYRNIQESIEQSIQQQDEGYLQEPLTNIQNGLGVFAAFNYDSVAYNIVQVESN